MTSTAFRSLVMFPLFVLGVIAASPDPAAADLPGGGLVRGVATFRERIALPPSAVLEVKLMERGRGRTNGRTVARVVRSNPGQVPIPFEIRYDTRRLRPATPYVVRATITEGNWVRFAGEAPYVPRRGRGPRITVFMRAEGRGEHGRPRAELEDVRWVPVRIGDRVLPSSGGSEPWILLDSRSRRASGSGGCNRLSAAYVSEDHDLRFGPIAATRMACRDIHVETAFFRALVQTRHYRVRGRQLELRDGYGNAIVLLEERSLR